MNFCGVEIIEELNVNGQIYKNIKPTNIPMQILESQFMLVLVDTIIAPIIIRSLKEKYDIQIEKSQIAMIMNDAISTVNMYSSEANNLRDRNGKLSKLSQKDLRNLAFSSIKANYTLEKYNTIVSNIGVRFLKRQLKT